MYSWRQVWQQEQAFYLATGGDGDSQEDREVSYRVMVTLPAITFDRDEGKRRVIPMRWGLAARKPAHGSLSNTGNFPICFCIPAFV